MRFSRVRISAYSLAAVVCLSASASFGQDSIRSSVVKIFATQRYPDYLKPWTKRPSKEISGSGAVLEGKRILTNAHVASFANQIYVQGYQSADRFAAQVVGIAPDIDLALLSVEDEAFWKDRPPLALSPDLPKVGDKISAYGYPMGGSDLSVTEGIVSRIEFEDYYFNGQGLRIQVDAAVNPGNSGGPAISNGGIVGIVFSYIPDAQNIGYLIPVEEIQLFMRDLEDGHYDGKPMMFDEWQTLENDGIRDKLGMSKDQTGVMISRPLLEDEDYPLKKWDVLARINGFDIDNQGMIQAEANLRLRFEYAIQQRPTTATVTLARIRGGETAPIEMAPARDPGKAIPYRMDALPEYFICGPLCFTTLTEEFLQALPDQWSSYLWHRGSPLVREYSSIGAPKDREYVVISCVFPHALMKGYDEPVVCSVKSINNIPVKNLEHLVQLIRDSRDEFLVFDFYDQFVETMSFHREEMLKATEDILVDNGIRYQGSEKLRTIWEGMAPGAMAEADDAAPPDEANAAPPDAVTTME